MFWSLPGGWPQMIQFQVVSVRFGRSTIFPFSVSRSLMDPGQVISCQPGYRRSERLPVCVMINIKVNDHLYKHNGYFTGNLQTSGGWPAVRDEKRFNEQGPLRKARAPLRSRKTGRLFRKYSRRECKTGRSQNSRSGFCD